MHTSTAPHTNQDPEHSHGHFNIKIANGGLDFHPLTLEDPMPVGRQLLELAGLHPADEFSLVAVLPSGDFEDVRLDETFDLRGKGVERFIAFQTDRSFKFTVKDSQMEWGKPVISGKELYKLAKPAEGEAVFLEVRGGEDRVIEREELIDLNAPGIERFFTAPKPTPEFHIVVNGRPFTVVQQFITFEQVLALAGMAPSPDIVYEMTFKHAAGKPHSGSLNEGGSVKVKKNGTIFNVTATIRS